jgi:hypothetical protein
MRHGFDSIGHAFLGVADHDIMSLRFDFQSIDQEEDPAGRLSVGYRQRAASAAFGVHLNVLVQFFLIIIGLILAHGVGQAEDSGDRGSRGAGVGSLQAVFECGIQQFIPRRGGRKVFCLRYLVVEHETDGIDCDADPVVFWIFELGWDFVRAFGRVRLEHTLFHSGGKVSAGPPNSTSTCGLPFSATTRARASPEEKRRKLTLTPVSLVKAANTAEEYFSGQMV